MARSNRSAKKLVIHVDSSASTTPRRWSVKLGVEDPETKEIKFFRRSNGDRHFDLEDPWNEKEYDEAMSPETRRSDGNIHVLSQSLRDYGKVLFDRLELQDVLGDSDCDRISIHEDIHHAPGHRRRSIHSLLWEVLEHPDIWSKQSKPGAGAIPPRITRVLTGQHSDETLVPTKNCRILLVVARSFQYFVEDSFQKTADARPGLIQDTLLQIGRYLEKKGLGSGFTLDVVRPGIFSQLVKFLSAEKRAGRKYDIIHFDLHGDISEKGPVLRFGTSKYDLRFIAVEPGTKFVVPDAQGYDDVDVRTVADVLTEHSITRVALNACLSSSTRYGTLPSMAEIFIESGITSVSAMSYMILDDAAKTYYDAFYGALILGEKTFHEAAAKGREALRKSQRSSNDWLNPTNYRNRVFTFNNKFLPHGPPILGWFCLIIVLVFPCICPWPNMSYRVPAPSFFLPPTLPWLMSSADNEWFVRPKQVGLWIAIAILTIFVALYRHQAPSEALALQRYMFGLASRIFERVDHCSGYDAFNEEQSKKGQTSSFELLIEHMTLEDHLYRKRRLYLCGDNCEVLNKTLMSLTKLWLRTGFIDEAHIKDARDFLGFLSRPDLTKSFFNWSAFPDKYRKERGPRTLLLIRNVDEFVDKLKRQTSELAGAEEVQKMNSWINNHSAGPKQLDTYVVITGDKPKNWWTEQVWGPEIDPDWGNAFPYNPNIFEGRREAGVTRSTSDPYM